MNRLLMAVCSLALAAVVSSNEVPLAAATHDHPRYAYNYAVHDPHTRDNKAQWETRNGDVVKGSYSLVEPDGGLRVVDYHANDLNGFSAVVKKIGPTVHSAPLIPIPTVANLPHISPIVAPLNYGFGAAPLAIGLPKAAHLGHWSLPWDPFTGSYGGWVPLGGPLLLPHGPYATIFSKKFDSKGRLIHAKVTGPIPIGGKTLVFRKKH